MKHLYFTVLIALAFNANLFSQVTLLFPYEDENLTDIACAFKAKITSNGPYELELSRTQDFSGTVIKRAPQADRENPSETKDSHDIVYFLTYQGKLVPGDRWVLDTGIWYWRITADNGAVISETRRLTVNDDRTVTARTHEISPNKPLFHFRLGGRPGNPAVALAEIIPDHLKDNIVLDIGHSFYQFHDGEDDLFEYSKLYNDLGFKFSVDLGLASTLGRVVSPGEVEIIYRDLPNFVGGEIAEMFYKYRNQEVDNTQLHSVLELSRKYGKFFLFADMNWKYSQWQAFNYQFYDIFDDEGYNDYFLPVYKTTDPFGAYTCVSAIQGMKLTGMVNNIGIWSDMWTWEKFGQVDTIALDDWINTGHSSGNEQTFPYIQNMKQFIYGMTFGSTVFMVEPELQWGWDAAPNDLYYRYILPFMSAVVKENIIPSETELNKNFKVIVDTEFTSDNPGASTPITYLNGNIWGDYLRNTFGIASIAGYDETITSGFGDIKRASYVEMTPNTDRYPSGIPFLPKPGISAPVLNGNPLAVLAISDLDTSVEVNTNLNTPYYPDASTNDAFAVKIDKSVFVFNTAENHDIVQQYEVPINASGVVSLSGDINLMSYVIGRIRDNDESIFFQTNAHVKNASILGSKYDLPTYPSILKFKCAAEPTLVSGEMSAITSSWDNVTATLTVTIDHEMAGAVNFTLTNAATNALTVNSGTGDGDYYLDTVVAITADAAPVGQEFDKWTGDVSTIANVNSASTTITMPNLATAITATYKLAEIVNLVQNFDFETGSLPVWTSWGPVSVISSNVHEGSYSVFVNGSGAAEQVITVEPNTEYTLSAWAKLGAGGQQVTLGVKEHGGFETSIPIVSTTYKQVSLTFTTGISNTEAKIYFYCPNGIYQAYGDDFAVYETALLGINDKEITNQEIRVFPNPFSTELTISLNNNSDYNKISLIDIYGKTYMTESIAPNKGVISFFVPNLELRTGLYFIRLTGVSKTKTIKVIKSRL